MELLSSASARSRTPISLQICLSSSGSLFQVKLVLNFPFFLCWRMEAAYNNYGSMTTALASDVLMCAGGALTALLVTALVNAHFVALKSVGSLLNNQPKMKGDDGQNELKPIDAVDDDDDDGEEDEGDGEPGEDEDEPSEEGEDFDKHQNNKDNSKKAPGGGAGEAEENGEGEDEGDEDGEDQDDDDEDDDDDDGGEEEDEDVEEVENEDKEEDEEEDEDDESLQPPKKRKK